MNKFKIALVEKGNYLLNNKQLFLLDTKILNHYLNQLDDGPLLVLDLEFFNVSHDKRASVHDEPKFYETLAHDVTYLIQYAFVPSLATYKKLKYCKKIKTLCVTRKATDYNFDFLRHYWSMITKFFAYCEEKKVKTFVCSGGATDFKLINTWFHYLYGEKELAHRTPPFATRQSDVTCTINRFDVYDMLTNDFSFENMAPDGDTFIEPRRLRPGRQNKQMLALPSMAKLFSWVGDAWNFTFRDEGMLGIYELCCQMLEFYNKKTNISFFGIWICPFFDGAKRCHQLLLKWCLSDADFPWLLLGIAKILKNFYLLPWKERFYIL